MTCFVIESYLNRKELTYDLEALANGVLSGLVAICGGCNSMYPWGAVLTGIGAGISFILFKYLCFRIKASKPGLMDRSSMASLVCVCACVWFARWMTPWVRRRCMAQRGSGASSWQGC